MTRSKFGERFAARTGGLSEMFGVPFEFVGRDSEGWSSVTSDASDEFRVTINADFLVSQSLSYQDMRDLNDDLRTMVANHDFVFHIKTDQPGLSRAPRDGDQLQTIPSGPLYSVDHVLDELNGWVICGCSA